MNFSLDLITLMIERISVIATIAFLLTRWEWFRRLLERKPTANTRVLSVGIFGLIGIIGTYTGIVVNPEAADYHVSNLNALSQTEAIVNTRVLGVAIAGILGGPLIGLGAGLLAGGHRLLLGGFTALACSVATAWEGLMAGLIVNYWLSPGRLTISRVWLIGLLAEISQMVIILLLARPFDRAWELVQIIGLPMIVGNSVGLGIFFAIIQSVVQREQQAEANFAHKSLAIADQTLPHLRKGLSAESAHCAAEIIYDMTGVAAVAFTDTKKILAFVGKGDDHHIAGDPLKTEATIAVLQEGQPYIASNKGEIGCSHGDCPLAAAVILPLRQRGEVVGTLKLYFEDPRDITPSQIELTNGLANLFSTQLELARVDEQERLLADAEIKALQAQVNPHFLFNSLNTIVALIRKEPGLARQIAVQLGQFLRSNIQAGHQKWRSLADEINHIRDYLAIEEVRFSDRLQTVYDISEEALDIAVPPLILLPLAENAIKYGIVPLNRPGMINIAVHRDNNGYVRVMIRDDGAGMSRERLKAVLSGKVCVSAESTGIGIYSVIKRLSGIYGSRAAVRIESEPDKGTSVVLLFPADK